METAEFIGYIVKSGVFFFTGLFVAIILKKAIRGEPGKKREMEQIKQEMAELRESMDRQYADLTLMLEDARRARELERLRQPDTEQTAQKLRERIDDDD